MSSESRGPNVGTDSVEPADAQTLKLKLRLAAEPERQGYSVTIELVEVAVTVETRDKDLRRAVRAAADSCAERLREKGFTVTAAEVLTAIDDALENSELVRESPGGKSVSRLN
jgi:hypothetical protein